MQCKLITNYLVAKDTKTNKKNKKTLQHIKIMIKNSIHVSNSIKV